MKIKKIMLFTYDFPHKKTQDFIFRLLVEGYKIEYLISAPRVELNIPKSSFHLAPHNVGLMHPKDIAKHFGIKYIVSDHNSEKTIKYLKNNPADLYIISGARILKKDTIIAAGNRVLNIHPGILPEVRGLDTLLWSIFYDKPIGISAHFISPRIDLGELIYKENLMLYKDDTFIDISLRLLEKQTDILMKSLEMIEKDKKLVDIDTQTKKYNTKMTPELEHKMVLKFPEWLKKYA